MKKLILEIEPAIDSSFRWMMTGFGGVLAGGFAMAALLTNTLNLQWLKIWIAPKIWLIEYTASLTGVTK